MIEVSVRVPASSGLVEPFEISSDTGTPISPTVSGLGYVGEMERPMPANAVDGIPESASRPTRGTLINAALLADLARQTFDFVSNLFPMRSPRVNGAFHHVQETIEVLFFPFLVKTKVSFCRAKRVSSSIQQLQKRQEACAPRPSCKPVLSALCREHLRRQLNRAPRLSVKPMASANPMMRSNPAGDVGELTTGIGGGVNVGVGGGSVFVGVFV
jgi:hypothetical protein